MSGLVELTIFKCTDQQMLEWYVVDPDKVPEWLKEPEIIDMLLSRCYAQAPGESDIYIGLRSGEAGHPNLLAQSKLLDQHGQKFH